MSSVSRFFSLSVKSAFVAALCSFGLHPIQAADTDLFITGAGGQTTRPNVLIILDNTANWGPMFAAEKNALKAVLGGLEPGLFNVGLMMYVETGNGNGNNDGGYVRFAIRPIDNRDNGDAIVDNAAESLVKTVGNLDEIGDRSNNAVYGLVMNEAYKYFARGNSYSQVQVKRDYWGNNVIPAWNGPYFGQSYSAFPNSTTFKYQLDPTLRDNCKENHIIIISNGKGNDNANATKTATDLLAAAGGDTTEIPVSPNGYQGNVGDEWARFMSRDPDAAKGETRDTKPVIYTHAILVESAGAPNGQYPADWPPFLRSMSVDNGKGSYYYSDGTESNIKQALESAFKEIQATNSVFASSALPINTTVRGTFLNQVYMGVFRPEASAVPRWTGNLKLYKVAATTGTSGQVTSIFLAGQDNQPIEDQTNGFTKTLAQSFWTSTSSFWTQTFASRLYDYKEIAGAGGASDLPDGEFVEKGGAAQRLRTIYSGASGNELSNRNLYTHLGSTGTSLTAFDTNLNASYFGLSQGVGISSISRSGGTVTVGTSGDHGFSTGDLITIGGVTPADYNFTAVITKTGAATFTYPITELPVSPATTASSIQASLASASATINVSSITRIGNVANVAATAHGLLTGNRVEISGATQPEYNQTAAVTRIDANTFSYSVPESPSTTITLNSAKVCPNPSQASCPAGTSQDINSMTRTAGSLTVAVTTAKNHGFSVGNVVLIEGVLPSPYNGLKTVVTAPSTAKKDFTFALPSGSLGPTSPATGTIVMRKANPAFTITSLVRSGSTVTATTSAAHGFVVNNSVAISGADQPEYNGTFSVASAPTLTTFTYPVVTSPSAPTAGGGTATKAVGNISKDELVKWVRGENRLQEDNATLTSSALVRGHLHGDVLHSRPVVVNYNRLSAGTGSPPSSDRDVAVFYGANDGFLHAVKGGRDATDGKELWAYIAEDHMAKLKTLYGATPSILKKPDMYYFDGTLTALTRDANDDGRIDTVVNATDAAWLYATMRRGGRGIHALDITNALNADPALAKPTLLWKNGCPRLSDNLGCSTGWEELGQSWSEATPIKIPGVSVAIDAVVFGMGYDSAANDPVVNTTTGLTDTSSTSSRHGTAKMGRGVMIANAQSGALIWAATAADSTMSGSPAPLLVPGMTCDIASDVAAVDLDLDGLTDRLYLSDTCANLWRVDIVGADTTKWAVRQLGKFGGTGVDQRKFLFRPDVVALESDPSKLAILIGSGDREAPFDLAVSNAFYMVIDSVGADCPNCERTVASVDIPPVRSGDLCERNTLLSNKAAVDRCYAVCVSKTADEKLFCVQDCLAGVVKDENGQSITDNTCLTPTVGWKYTYSNTNAANTTPVTYGEKTVNAPTTVGTTVFFGTNVPQSVINDQQCGGLGEARNYEIDYATGAPAANFGTGANSDTLSFYAKRPGGGFPPSPVGVITKTDDGILVEGVITGTQIKDPPSPALRKRSRIYWYKVLDKK